MIHRAPFFHQCGVYAPLSILLVKYLRRRTHFGAIFTRYIFLFPSFRPVQLNGFLFMLTIALLYTHLWSLYLPCEILPCLNPKMHERFYQSGYSGAGNLEAGPLPLALTFLVLPQLALFIALAQGFGVGATVGALADARVGDVSDSSVVGASVRVSVGAKLGRSLGAVAATT